MDDIAQSKLYGYHLKDVELSRQAIAIWLAMFERSTSGLLRPDPDTGRRVDAAAAYFKLLSAN
ncbi:hypothetical protein [Paenibacillus cremeus]|uniref:Uncharacterized protein n=1 Tax=Paenibacillus cremeus TaxID=2163881 RepID=A0A559K7P0_9BACL|nr:hypothetical protein [Paenibacillus cremeus]TVY08103.1 hypothetical protein FPZ49_20325 [Paenibacillus cremeus]